MMTSGPSATPDTAAAPGSAPASSSGSATGTPAFDNILMLQSLAATTEGLAASVETGETDFIAADDASDDDDTAEELEASLAFLSQLLMVTGGSARKSDTGGESQAGSQDSAALLALKAGEGGLLEAANDSSITDAEALLSATAEPLESRSDASQNLARAADLLASGARAGAAADKSTLTTPARDPRWADELGARVTLMVRARESSASLQMTPVDLGPVEVNVTVKDSQLTVHFGASQAETRALLEASLPKLREMLAAQGFQLTDSSVSSGFARSQREDASPSRGSAGEAETSTTEARTVRSLGLLDLYA